MPIVLKGFQELTREAVRTYWRTLDEQSLKQGAKNADRGNRAAVTGGKQMRGFCELVQKVLTDNGVPKVHVFTEAKLELPGYFRPTKNWDMLVVSDRSLIAAIEFKSQRGPSFGNNFNNRAEEAIGTGNDLWTAFREGAFARQPPPWLGWVMLLEDCPQSTAPVTVKEPHFKVFPEFQGASYARRYELLLRRLVREKLFNASALLMATDKQGRDGRYVEPADDLRVKPFLAALVGHAMAFHASES